MLKYEVQSVEKMDEAIAKLYDEVKTDEGTVYRLKVDGVRNDEIPKMQAKLDELLSEKKAEQAKRKEAEKAAKDAAAAQAEKDGDIEAVKKSLREHYEPQLSALQKERDTFKAQLHKRLVGDEATNLATRIAVDTESLPILAEYIRNRLDVSEKDGTFETIVKGDDGKSSGLTVDEFVKKLETNPGLSRLVKASDAAGGGANGANRGGGAAKQKTVTRAQLAEMNPVQQMEHFKGGGAVTD